MSERQETVDDIIAEMRIFKCRNLETGKLELCNAIANYFADRLDTAHKREMSKNASKNGADFGQLGNAAKDVARQLRAWAEQVDPFSKDGSAPRRLRALAARLEGGAK